MSKKLVSISIILTAGIVIFAARKINSEQGIFYQCGELLNDNGRQILVVPNLKETEFLEIAKNDKFIKRGSFQNAGSASNVMINKNEYGNSIIAIEGDIIVEYDANNLNNVKVIRKIGPFWKNYDYYYDMEPYGNNEFLTAGEKGITVWDRNTLSIITKVYDKKTYDVAKYNRSIYGLGEEGAIIINAEGRKIYDKYIRTGLHKQKIFVNDIGVGYFPGDDVLKLRTFTDYKNLAHPSGAGNGVDGFQDYDFIYFVNGWDVWKVKEKDLTAVKKVNASKERGEWAAGVKTMELAQGKRVVVFNGQDILLFDTDLTLLDKYTYKKDFIPSLTAKTMKVSPPYGNSGDSLIVAGSGFWPGETVILKIGPDIYELKADNIGEVSKAAKVPDVSSASIKVSMSGKQSGFGHSYDFKITK
ncbi:MAG: hypothetical protein V1860_03880 [bacterium]